VLRTGTVTGTEAGASDEASPLNSVLGADIDLVPAGWLAMMLPRWKLSTLLELTWWTAVLTRCSPDLPREGAIQDLTWIQAEAVLERDTIVVIPLVLHRKARTSTRSGPRASQVESDSSA
jgi:hypothetical protein